MSFCLSMLLALFIDRFFGWPDSVFRVISHPVVGFGKLINWCDCILNKDRWRFKVRLLFGIISLAMVLIPITCLSYFFVMLFPTGVVGTILTALFAWPFIASKSLADHVRTVGTLLASDDLVAAREAVSKIVGRNTQELDKNGVARAALESLAENTSDGVTAPLFWGVLFGLPGLLGYKVINTFDSMVGYKTPRYLAFGWAAARLDDFVNFFPARLTGLGYIILSSSPRRGYRIIKKDAPNHRSHNAGWAETGFAVALNIRLSGPRNYDGRVTHYSWINQAGRDPDANDIFRGLVLFNRLIWLNSGLILLSAMFLFSLKAG